jgi:hypothetical protein
MPKETKKKEENIKFTLTGQGEPNSANTDERRGEGLECEGKKSHDSRKHDKEMLVRRGTSPNNKIARM